MKDPYQTLGVARTATDEEIKKAYRDLARKYHPDNYVNHPLADLVEEKMKEVNEAYDTIQKERASGRGGGAYGSSYSSYSGSHNSSGSYSDSYSDPFSAGNRGSADYAKLRRLINEKRFSEAEIMLDSVPSTERNAEWNFLKGCVLIQRGRYYDALRHIETACYLDPDNAEYRNARASLKNSTAYGSERDDMCCDICASALCANMLCGCCGGH